MNRNGNESGRLTILQGGFLIAPVAVFTVSLLHAAAFCFAFLLITGLTVLISSVIPKRIPFPVRIVLYSVTGGLVYIPAALLTVRFFPSVQGGIYIPLLSAALYLTAARDHVFPKKGLLKALLLNLFPQCAAALFIGAVRELLGSGTVAGIRLFAAPLPCMLQPSAGLILLILLLTALAAFRGKEAPDADCL